jgi:hypothetical protein
MPWGKHDEYRGFPPPFRNAAGALFAASGRSGDRPDALFLGNGDLLVVAVSTVPRDSITVMVAFPKGDGMLVMNAAEIDTPTAALGRRAVTATMGSREHVRMLWDVSIIDPHSRGRLPHMIDHQLFLEDVEADTKDAAEAKAWAIWDENGWDRPLEPRVEIHPALRQPR